jgi:hypothetical protein
MLIEGLLIEYPPSTMRFAGHGGRCVGRQKDHRALHLVRARQRRIGVRSLKAGWPCFLGADAAGAGQFTRMRSA